MTISVLADVQRCSSCRTSSPKGGCVFAALTDWLKRDLLSSRVFRNRNNCDFLRWNQSCSGTKTQRIPWDYQRQKSPQFPPSLVLDYHFVKSVMSQKTAGSPSQIEITGIHSGFSFFFACQPHKKPWKTFADQTLIGGLVNQISALDAVRAGWLQLFWIKNHKGFRIWPSQ
jgi:hypothetical protein